MKRLTLAITLLAVGTVSAQDAQQILQQCESYRPDPYQFQTCVSVQMQMWQTQHADARRNYEACMANADQLKPRSTIIRGGGGAGDIVVPSNPGAIVSYMFAVGDCAKMPH